MKEYTIEQFPKNKEQTELSTEQAVIRKRAKKVKPIGTDRQCRRCGKVQPITEYYPKVKGGERRAATCRDCQLERAGVKEVGRQRYATAIQKKGFRRCGCCKETFPMTTFSRNSHSKNGYGYVCQRCNNKMHDEFIKKQRQELGDFYVRQWGKRNYGMSEFTGEDIDRLRAEITAKQQPKYHLDGLSFMTMMDFARYLSENYNISEHRTCKRIDGGYSEADCLLSEKEVRARVHTRGEVLVTDTITGETTRYPQSSDPKLRELFSRVTITLAIKRGKPTRVTSLSKYPHPCTIQRVDPKTRNAPA